MASPCYITEWYGSEVPLDAVTAEMIDQFEEAHAGPSAGRLRTMMRLHDPVRFRRRLDNSHRRVIPDRGDGSEFFLINFFEKRYEPMSLRRAAFNTKRLYRTTLIMFDRFLGRRATIDDLNDESVNAFAAARIAQGLSKYSVNKDLFNLLALWRWAHRRGFVDRWPDLDLEKPPQRDAEAWFEDEFKLIYSTSQQLPGRIGKFKARDWWGALLLVENNTAERIGAVRALQWKDVDLDRGWVRFVAETRKGSIADASFPLSRETINALGRIKGAEGPVFPWPYSYTYLWKRFGAILRSAGLPDDAKSKFHRIRKTVASYVEARGGNATAMLRHSKREITKAYLDPRIVKPQQPIDFMFRLSK